MQARMFNLEHNRTIRDLNPEDIDMLVSVQGMVTRASPIIPDLKCVVECMHPFELNFTACACFTQSYHVVEARTAVKPWSVS